jgi:hypothetical protein
LQEFVEFVAQAATVCLFLAMILKLALRDWLRDGLRDGLMPVVEVGGAKALENGLKPVVQQAGDGLKTVGVCILVGVVAIDTLWRVYRKFGW